MKCKVFMRHMMYGFLKMIVCGIGGVVSIFVQVLGMEFFSVLIISILPIVVLCGIFDWCLAVYTMCTLFMKEEKFVYWSRFKILITEDVIVIMFFFTMFYILVSSMAEEAGNIENLLTINGLMATFFALFSAVITVVLCIALIQDIIEINSKESFMISVKLISKGKHFKWAIHCCEIEYNNRIEKILLPEKNFLKKMHNVSIGETYEFKVFKFTKGSYYWLISVKEEPLYLKNV